MFYDDVVSFFHGPSNAARALGVDRRLVDGWKKRRIPTKHQLKAQLLSDGKLELDDKAVAEAKEFAAVMPSETRAA